MLDEQTRKDLYAAAEVIERHGWTTGRARNKDTGRVCMYGAIAYALSARHIAITETPSAMRSACDAVANHLRRNLVSYNDSAVRDGEHAAATLRAAADQE